jgi:hypothetical protein
MDQQPTRAPASTEARAEAARILRAAEMMTDLAQMDRYLELAQQWINLASLDEEART